MKIQKRIADAKLYGDKRSINDIKYIVVQTVENRPISHYYVYGGEVVQFIPDDFLSNSVNGRKFCSKGYLHGICTQYTSLSIGLSHNPTEDDIDACIKLIMTLKQRYHIDNENIVRQKDVTGEANPEKWFNDDSWNRDIKSNLIDIKKVAE